MDFNFSESQEAYRAEVRDWLEKNVPDWAKDEDASALFGEEDGHFERQRDWHQKLYDAGVHRFDETLGAFLETLERAFAETARGI